MRISTLPPISPGRLARRWCWLLLLVAVVVAGFILNNVARDNFHAVAAGQVYRSGQMDSNALTRVARQYGIKSVFNLRGRGDENNEWYIAETNIAAQLGLSHFDIDLSASREVTDQEIEQILATIAGAPKPILIHCNRGADRSGFVGALYLYSFAGRSPRSAKRQLSIYYGHFPHLFWGDTGAMDRSFWRYVSNHAPKSGPMATSPATLKSDKPLAPSPAYAIQDPRH